MTHILSRRFRLAALAVLAAATLTGGTVAAASASTTGQPSPPSYGQQGDHHQARHCEFDWIKGITLDQDGQGQDIGYGQAPYGQPKDEQRAEKVEVFQLTKVCETGEHLTVTDVGRPYVQETEQRQVEPVPYVTPSPDHSPNVYLTPTSSPS